MRSFLVSMVVNFHNWSVLKKCFFSLSYTKSTLERVIRFYFPDSKIQKADIIFVSEEKIMGLNKQFRKKNTPTDVLTFIISENPLIGEIYVCPEYISKKYDEREVLRSVIHGFLHLEGYEHSGNFQEEDFSNEEMFVKQENILQNIWYEINSRSGKPRRKISADKA